MDLQSLNFVILVILCYIVIQSNGDTHPSNIDLDLSNDDTSYAFRKLLKTIVDLNRERFDTMKKLTNLQDFNFASSRYGDDDGEGKIYQHLLAILLVNQTATLTPEENYQSTEKEPENYTTKNIKRYNDDDDDDNDDVSAENNEGESTFMAGAGEGEEQLRMWKSCSKKAAKVCKKACVSSHKEVCELYHCSSRMKKAFKKECKNSCRSRFAS